MNDELNNLINNAEMKLKNQFEQIEKICEYNSLKVLTAFHKNKISEIHFNSTNGYGYNDIGRDTLEKVYSDVFKCEDALVRSQFISGSHALTVALFAMLRPNDTMLCITSEPYDTLHQVIGIKENSSSLISYGINYEQVDLIEDDFNYAEIEKKVKNGVKLVYIQRSKGYSTRKSISINMLDKVIKFVKSIDKKVIIMVDNCYCEFVSKKEPTEVGADIVIGSLIKNLGGGIAQNGAYIVGEKHLINLCSERLNLPGEGKEVGPSLGNNKYLFMGLYMAPLAVKNSLKTAVLTSLVLDNLGYKVEPLYDEERVDIVQSIYFNSQTKLISYCQGIQMGSAVDSYVLPEPSGMPGYEHKIIMASGSFTQGSSIEISCDGPIREPYIAYQQGSLTYEYGKIALKYALEQILK